MRTIKTPATEQELKDRYYEDYKRQPSALEHIFGMGMHNLDYRRWKAWYQFIDAILPDWFPMGTLQGFLFRIIDRVYDYMAYKAYHRGARLAWSIEQGLSKIFTNAKDKIDSEITKLREKVETELFNPLKNKINNELMPKLEDAKNKLNSLDVDVAKALDEVDTMRNNIAGFGDNIDDFRSKLSSFDSRLKSFNSTLSSLDSRIRNSENSLTSLNTKIKNLTSKASNVDNQLSNHKNLLDNLNKRVANLEGREPTEEEEKPFFQLPKFLGG